MGAWGTNSEDNDRTMDKLESGHFKSTEPGVVIFLIKKGFAVSSRQKESVKKHLKTELEQLQNKVNIMKWTSPKIRINSIKKELKLLQKKTSTVKINKKIYRDIGESRFDKILAKPKRKRSRSRKSRSRKSKRSRSRRSRSRRSRSRRSRSRRSRSRRSRSGFGISAGIIDNLLA
jgi:hypothetical protein